MNSGHSYVIQYKDKVIKAHPLRKEEVRKIYDFMKEVTIDSENYKEYLGIGCESLFKKKGALIETSEEMLYDAVNRPEMYSSMGIWNEDGTPEAFIIAENEDFDDLISQKNLKMKEGFEDKFQELYKAKLNKTLMYKGDMRVRPKSDIRKCFFIMFYFLLKDMVDNGYRVGASEVFNITAYNDGNEWIDIDVYNERSFKAQVRGIKAEYIADGLTKEKEIGNCVKIRYYSKIIGYDIVSSLKYVEDGIKSLNLTYREE